MNKFRSIGLAVILPLFAGCGGTDGQSSSEVASAAAQPLTTAPELYIVTQKDLRTCAAPLCGGYYVKSVNSAVTVCDDGYARAQCYVAAFDFTGLAGMFTKQPALLSTTPAATYAAGLASANAYLEATIKAGGAVVLGQLKTVVVNGKAVGELVAEDGWVGFPWVKATPPSGEFFVTACTNATCAPMPALREEVANSCQPTKLLDDVDVSKIPPPGDPVSTTPVALGLVGALTGVNQLLVEEPAIIAAKNPSSVVLTKLPSLSYVVSGSNVMSGATVEWITASNVYTPMALFYYAVISSGCAPSSFFTGGC